MAIRWSFLLLAYRFYMEKIKLASFTALFPLKLIALITQSLPPFASIRAMKFPTKANKNDVRSLTKLFPPNQTNKQKNP